MDTATLSVYCVDIGSVRRAKSGPDRGSVRFGWAYDRWPGADPKVRRGGGEIIEVSEAVSADLRSGLPVALGFEAPQWVPLPSEPLELGRARPGENDRAWSASAGAGVLATGIPQVVWILLRIRELCGGTAPDFFLSWEAFSEVGSGLFLWEAFVTKDAKRGAHREDAAAAVTHFLSLLPDPTKGDLGADGAVHSLLGAALLRAGWSEDVGLLRRPCLVLRAPKL